MTGVVLDVPAAAELFGCSEKMIRGQVDRGLLPHKRLGGRVIFVRDELVSYMSRLPGTTTAEALKNATVRAGGGDSAA